MNRAKRRSELIRLSRKAKEAEMFASLAVVNRNDLIEQSQGPPVDGKFTFDELSTITGLSRTRIGQIIYGLRGKRNKESA